MAKKKSKTKKRIFLVEDHAVLRECLKLFIGQEPDMEVCGEASSAAEAFAAIPALRPDAVITDISMPGMNGIEFLKNLKALHPGIAAIVLSMHDESVYAERALRAGALGYVMKKESTGEVITALRKAFVGETHVSERIVTSLMLQALDKKVPGKNRALRPVDILSDRELEVFEHLGRGQQYKEHRLRAGNQHEDGRDPPHAHQRKTPGPFALGTHPAGRGVGGPYYFRLVFPLICPNGSRKSCVRHGGSAKFPRP